MASCKEKQTTKKTLILFFKEMLSGNSQAVEKDEGLDKNEKEKRQNTV